MSKMEAVRSAMFQAMKDKDKERKEALSLLLSALKSKAIDKREDLTEDEENTIILHEIKQAQESIDTANGRDDIIAENQFRVKTWQEFAPQMMTEDEIRTVINGVLEELAIEHVTAKDKGKIMKILMPKVKGKADGSVINTILSSMME